MLPPDATGVVAAISEAMKVLSFAAATARGLIGEQRCEPATVRSSFVPTTIAVAFLGSSSCCAITGEPIGLTQILGRRTQNSRRDAKPTRPKRSTDHATVEHSVKHAQAAQAFLKRLRYMF